MVMLTAEIRESLAAAKTVFLATASKDHIPNVVPIGAFTLLNDETLLISDQFFLKTLRNLRENPYVALSWWGDKGGFQIKGPVTLHTDDEIFRKDVAWMKELRPGLTPKSAVLVTIKGVFQVRPGPDAGKQIL
jgi:hypothetical protein